MSRWAPSSRAAGTGWKPGNACGRTCAAIRASFYSYGEAVDGNGRTIKNGDAPLAWGGNVALCTRDGKFELSDHKDCAVRGLNSAGFAAIDLGGQGATTVHFKE